MELPYGVVISTEGSVVFGSTTIRAVDGVVVAAGESPLARGEGLPDRQEIVTHRIS